MSSAATADPSTWGIPSSELEAASTSTDPSSWGIPPSELGESAVPPTKPDLTASETANREAGIAYRGINKNIAGLASIPAGAISEVAGGLYKGLTGQAHGVDYKGHEYVGKEADMLQATGTVPPPQQAATQPYSPQLSDFVHPEKWQQAAEYFSNRAGLPKPETKGERIWEATAGGATGGIPGALSAGATQATAEAGGGPVAQAITGTLAGLAPSGLTSLAKSTLRGGGSPAAIQANQAEAQNAGTYGGTPPINLEAGQAGESAASRGLATVSSKLPGGGPIKENRAGQPGQIEDTVDGIVRKLSPDMDRTSATAGETINAGVKTSRAKMSQAEGVAYQKVEDLAGKDTPMKGDNLKSTLQDINTPTGIPEIDSILTSAKSKAQLGAVEGATTPPETQPTSPYTSDFEAVQHQEPPTDLPLTYGALRGMRAKIGSEIDWGITPTNPGPNAELKRIYGALTQDISTGVKGIGPEAEGALKEANTLYKTNQGQRDVLDKIVDKIGGPEAVYRAATNGTKDGATKIGTVMKQLAPEDQDVLRATVLHRLGRKGGAVDQDFVPATYLNNWKNMSPDAKTAIFGGSANGSQLRSSLDSLSNTMDLLEKQGFLKKPATGLDTGSVLGHTAVGAGAMYAVQHAGVLASHPFLGTMSALLLSANPALSRALTNPKVVGWMASATKVPAASYVQAINQLNQINDPDAKALATAIKGVQ